MGFIRTAGWCKEPWTPWLALATTTTCSKNEFREANWEGISVCWTDDELYYVCSSTCCCDAANISALHGTLAIIILYRHKIYYYLAGTPQHKNCVDYLPYHKTISSVKLITQTPLPLQLCFCLLDISDSKIHKLT